MIKGGADDELEGERGSGCTLQEVLLQVFELWEAKRTGSVGDSAKKLRSFRLQWNLSLV
jgi:hypothetical protein